jgi:hypothetical protein
MSGPAPFNPALSVQFLDDGCMVVMYPASGLSRAGHAAMEATLSEEVVLRFRELAFQQAASRLMALFDGRVAGCENLGWCIIQRLFNEEDVEVVSLHESGLRKDAPGADGEDGFDALWAVNAILSPYLRQTLEKPGLSNLLLRLDGYTLSATTLPALLERIVDREFSPGTWERWLAVAAREDLGAGVSPASGPAPSRALRL